MDTARYVIGCLLVIGLPPGMVWWFLIHPFVHIWRRVGAKLTLTVGIVLLFASMIPLYRVRDALLMSDLGTNWITAGVGGCLAIASGWIALKRRKLLTMRILMGVPELEKGGKGGTLLTQGPYAVSRNPRYVEMVLGVFAYAAFSNYVGAYLMAVLTVPVIHLIVIMEEAELRDRFGEPYETYLATVPRYFPRRGGPGVEPE